MDRALQVHKILATRGLSLYRLSQKSAELFGHSSEFYVPHNLYSVLADNPKGLAICQVVALSQITNYRLFDWLLVFGFELDSVSRLRLALSRPRTTMLDSTVYDPFAWIPWVTERPASVPLAQIVPLGKLLAHAPARRVRDVLALNQRKFLYAVVGEQDLYASPQFAAGSVVRADPTRAGELRAWRDSPSKEQFFLIEHVFGWSCSQVIALEKDRVLLHCPQRPCMGREFRIGRDARILGIVDAEIRPMMPRPAGFPESKPWSLLQMQQGTSLRDEQTLKDLLRQSRLKSGLSFRQASALSRRIAEILRDKLYFAAASTLSDYETLAAPPRAIQKIITLCLLYGIGFEQFLLACGLPADQAGREPIPDELLARHAPQENSPRHRPAGTGSHIEAGPFGPALGPWEEVPLFLRPSVDEIAAIKNLSLSDLFWVGGDPSPRHPLLVNACLVAVNRRARKLEPHRRAATSYGPLHMILSRAGGYLCGRCTLHQGKLLIAGYPLAGVSAQEFRNGIDAEVAGQVTAILRRLGG